MTQNETRRETDEKQKSCAVSKDSHTKTKSGT